MYAVLVCSGQAAAMVKGAATFFERLWMCLVHVRSFFCLDKVAATLTF